MRANEITPQMAWAVLSPLLEPALRDGDTLDQVREQIERGEAQFWHGDKSCGVTEIASHRDFHFWLVGGDLAELMTMHHSAETWARALGCSRTLNLASMTFGSRFTAALIAPSRRNPNRSPNSTEDPHGRHPQSQASRTAR